MKINKNELLYAVRDGSNYIVKIKNIKTGEYKAVAFVERMALDTHALSFYGRETEAAICFQSLESAATFVKENLYK